LQKYAYITVILKLRSAAYQYGGSTHLTVLSAITFTHWAPKATECGEIMQNNDHYAIQGTH